MRKRNKWIAAGVGLWLTGAVCIGSGVFLDNPGSALTRGVQAATQSIRGESEFYDRIEL